MLRNIQIILFFVVCFSGVFGFGERGLSESCSNPDIIEMFDKSKHVFVGNIRGRKNNKDYHLELVWEIKESFKGKKKGTLTAEFVDEFASAKLKGWYKAGTKHLVFLNSINGKLKMNWCGGGTATGRELKPMKLLVEKSVKSIGLGPKQIKKLLNKGKLLSKTKKFPQAIATLDGFVSKGDSETSRLFLLSIAYGRNKQYARAIALNNQVISRDYRIWAAFYNNICFYSMGGKIQQSIKQLQTFEYALLDNQLDEKYQTKIARKYTKLLRSDNDLSQVRKNSQFKKYQQRFDNYSKWVVIPKKTRENKFEQAKLSFGKKSYAIAISQLNQLSFAFVDKSQEAERLALLARSQMLNNQCGLAIASANHAIHYNDESFEAYLVNVQCLARQKNIKNAARYTTLLSQALINCFSCYGNNSQKNTIKKYLERLKGQAYKSLNTNTAFKEALTDLELMQNSERH